MTYQEALDKAMKLLRLSKSPVPAEAALAASKAQEIIDRYKLDVTGIDYDAQTAKEDSEPVKDFGYGDPLDDMAESYKVIWGLRLASVVARANQTRIIYLDKRNETRRIGRTIKIVGRPSDVSTVRYLYSFFKLQIEQMAKEQCAGNSGAYVNQFCIGVIDTISAKLAAQKQQTFAEKRQEVSANPGALVRVNAAIARMDKKAADVDAFIKANMTLGRGRTRTVNGAHLTGRRAGQIAGQNIQFTGAKAGIGAGRKELQ